jgi:hypothetical protein
MRVDRSAVKTDRVTDSFVDTVIEATSNQI